MASHLQDLALLVARQAVSPSATGTDSPAATDDSTPACDSGNGFDGRLGVRISSIFVILVGGFLGAWFPTFAARHKGIGVPTAAFFFAKYFGSGVIVATAFIHLLAPAVDALTDPCLTGPITEYDWAEGIALMTVFVMFFVELMVMRYAKFGHTHDFVPAPAAAGADAASSPPLAEYSDEEAKGNAGGGQVASKSVTHGHVPGDDHFGHSKDHVDNGDLHKTSGALNPESYSAQLTAVFILEFGVIFHSIFIGLTLAVAGDEFITLYIVLVFHQTFEGLGLGSRLATIPWPKSKRWTPYILAACYSLSTPIAIAIGLGVRTTLAPTGATTLLVNGVFDSISAGILLYTGLIELMAHEFMFSPTMSKASVKTVLAAFFTMCAGAGLMALLGKWA